MKSKDKAPQALPYDPAKADPSLLDALQRAGQKGVLGAALENMQHREARKKLEREQARLAARIEARQTKQTEEPTRDPVQRYAQLEKEMLVQFQARGGRPMTPAQKDARDAQLKELNALAAAIQQDPALRKRASEKGLDRSVNERVRQQNRNRDHGIER